MHGKWSDSAKHVCWSSFLSSASLCTGADTPTAKFFINCLAEPPEEVAHFLVPRIRKVPQEMRSFNGSVGQVRLPACP